MIAVSLCHKIANTRDVITNGHFYFGPHLRIRGMTAAITFVYKIKWRASVRIKIIFRTKKKTMTSL